MTVEDVRRPLDESVLRHTLTGLSSIWRRVDVVSETGSTNSDLLARAAAGEDIDGAVLIAEHQTDGRGRRGRSWSAVPHAQITLSVGVDARQVPTAAWGWLSLAAGVSIVDAVATETGVAMGLKWPNDVQLDGRKLAGILAEVAPGQQMIVVGIGLNVSLRGNEISASDATSLLELGVERPDRQTLVARLLVELSDRIADWRAAGGATARLVADYNARSVTVGSLVRATLPGDSEIVGEARAVDDHGRLCIDSDGRTFVVAAGDVVHLRPALGRGPG